MTGAPAGARVLYQRSGARGAFECIDEGFLAGYRELGCQVAPWTDSPGEPTMRDMLGSFGPTHIVACMHNPDRTLSRWTYDGSVAKLLNAAAHVSARMNPPDVASFFGSSGIDFSRFPEFGVSSFYTRPGALTADERRVLGSGVVDLVRTPLAMDAIGACFRSVLETGVSVLEEPHAADTGRHPPVVTDDPSAYAASFVGRCWPFKWAHMEPYINALRDRFGDRLAVFGSGWPEGVSRGAIDDAGFARVVAKSSVCLSLHEPTQVLDRPFAQNERVFKLLSMGACVVSDANLVLAAQFDAGEELLLADSPDAMVALVEQVGDDPALGRAIAAAGRTRVLAEHTYAHRARRLLATAADPPAPGSVVSFSGIAQMCDGQGIRADVGTSDDNRHSPEYGPTGAGADAHP